MKPELASWNRLARRSPPGDGLRLDFVCVGPQRTGTTWIYNYLGAHPAVCVSSQVKETFYFDRHYDRGPRWYARHFERCRPGQRVGEVGSSYFHSPDAPARLRQHSPDATVVITLREPVTRLLSLYRLLQREAVIPGGVSFGEALGTEPALRETARYRTHVERWRNAMPPGHVHALLFEDLPQREPSFAASLCAAIGVAAEPVPGELHGPVNPDAEPRWGTAARGSARLTHRLRARGVNWPVNVAKRLGLRRVLYRRHRSAAVVARSEIEQAFVLIAPETEGLEDLLQVDLAPWRATWRGWGLWP